MVNIQKDLEKPWFSGKNPSHWTSRRLLEEQEKAYKAKISALEKRIKALEDEVKKLKVPWPKNGRFEEIRGFFHGFFMGKSGVKNGGIDMFMEKHVFVSKNLY